jgi:hypothetical protein
MKEILESILKSIEHIEKRPLMYTPEANFASVSNFINGYLSGIETSTTLNLNLHFSEWLNKNGQKTSLFWTSYLLMVSANDNDELAYQLMFKELKEFLEEKISIEKTL